MYASTYTLITTEYPDYRESLSIDTLLSSIQLNLICNSQYVYHDLYYNY